MKTTQTVKLGCTLAATLALLVASTHAAMVVVPGGLAGTEGNTGTRFPFSPENSPATVRSQQVYAASEFGSLGGPAFITQIAFRPDGPSGVAFSSTLPGIQINLSTTSAAPDLLSTTFANNIGANDTTVFSGALALSSANTGPASGPTAFDIIINLTTPFLYNPAAGNLLLDVRNFGGGTTTFFDAVNTTGDSVSRQASLDVNSTTANAALPTVGLVTQFTFAPIPEPTTALFGAALLAACGLSRRRSSVR